MMLLSIWPTALLLAVSSPFVWADTRLDRAADAAKVLQTYYDPNAGLWRTGAWWQAANAMQTLADLQDYSKAGLTDDVWSKTFANAPAHGGKNFVNSYYDDEGWWALAWIRAYDITGNKKYLNEAVLLFNDMLGTGGNATCGGIWWNKSKPQHMTSIANELFISVGAHLANRVTNGAYYYRWAENIWSWLSKSGLLQTNGLFRDGLDVNCKPQGGVWTYNQGVILGALVEMDKYKADAGLITQANDIASAAMTVLADKNGILHERNDNNTARYPFPVGHDGQSFKGAFIRNLARLQLHTNSAAQKSFITRNADSIWANARYVNGSLGVNWAGPLNLIATSPQQAAGLDVLVAAYAVAKSEKPGQGASAVKLPTSGSAKTTAKVTSKPTNKSTAEVNAQAAAEPTWTSASFPEAGNVAPAGPLHGMNLVICPVGDSITVGFHSSDGNGYREYLKYLLTKSGASVNLVGSVHNGNMSDPYHEGWSGAGIIRIQGNIIKDQALKKYKPNIVLLHAGTNDMSPGHALVYNPTEAPQWLESFIEYIYEQVPEVAVVVAQIIEPLNNPGRLTRTTTYNAAVVGLVERLAASGKKIMLANDRPWLTTANKTMYADGLHPNSNGYDVMAEGWFKALTKLAHAHKSWILPSGATTTSFKASSMTKSTSTPTKKGSSTIKKSSSVAKKSTSTVRQSTSTSTKSSGSNSKSPIPTKGLSSTTESSSHTTKVGPASLQVASGTAKASSTKPRTASRSTTSSSTATTEVSATEKVSKSGLSSSRAHSFTISPSTPSSSSSPNSITSFTTRATPSRSPTQQASVPPTISHPQYSFTRPVGFPSYFEGVGVWKRWLFGDYEGPMAMEEYNE